ncbi:MAG: hypothetical protein ACI4V1_10675, partial [Eubacteriales bacterium]
TPDRNRVLIRTNDDLAQTILTKEASLHSLRSALHVCGVAAAGAEIVVETGAAPKKRPPMDELTDV